MTGGTSDGKDIVAAGRSARWTHCVAFGAVCAWVIGTYAWSARSGFLELWGGRASHTYYNLLVQGLRNGHLHLNQEAPPGLAQLADPYDPVANGPYRSVHGLHDLSYYRGKLHLYFGITPALVLFWPWHEFTGRYLLHRDAVLIFCAVGFLAGAGLLVAVWRRYFAQVSMAVVAGCLAGLGFASGTPLLLARSDVYEVAISCGYALTLLALLAVWCALHQPLRRARWLAAASLAYGLAVGARPSLLFGASILLVPVVQAWRETAEPGQRRRLWPLLLAAAGPIVLIGFGLMLYNFLRFDSPFEFGQSYQLASDRQGTIQHFSLGYLWFNVRVYFLSMAEWTGRFPFVQDIAAGPVPAGHAEVEHAFGVLTSVPVVWAALAAPLAGRGLESGGRPALRWFAAACGVLFGVCALTLGLYSYTIARYQVEFLSPLLWLAVIGVFGLDRTLAGRPVWQRGIRLGWGLLLAWSVAFNLLARYELYSQTSYDLGLNVLQQGQVDAAIVHFQKALAWQPANGKARNDLGAALFTQGKPEAAVDCLKEAVRLKPEDAGARNNLGVVLFQLGRVPESIDQYERVLRFHPAHVESHYNLGNAFFRLGRMPEAAGQYAHALRLKPDYAEARRNLGVAQYQLGEELAAQGKWEEAIARYEQAIALKPDQPQIHQSLGLALSRRGQFAQAAAHFRRALEIEPGLMTALNNLAWLLATCGDAAIRDGARAVELAENANQLARGQDAGILDTLAAAYAEAGRFSDAVPTAQQAIELAKATGQSEPAQRIQARRQLYQAGRPYREGSAPPP